MDTKVVFQDAGQLATAMLAVFAVDIATGKDAEPIPVLLTTSDAVTKSAENSSAPANSKLAWARPCCCIIPPA